MKSLKFIVMILSIIFAVSYGFSLFLVLRSVNLQQASIRFFAYGFIPYTLAWLVFLRRRYFFSTFEHELTHLIVGLIFFKRPVGFHATAGEGGSTVLYGSNFIINLAPYFLPTLVFFILPVYILFL